MSCSNLSGVVCSWITNSPSLFNFVIEALFTIFIIVFTSWIIIWFIIKNTKGKK